MTAPLPDARLAEIRERAVAATVCPKAEGDNTDHVWSGSSFTHTQCAACCYTRPRGERAEETVELLVEVERLRAESESRRQAAAANAASAGVLQRQIEQQASELDRLNAELQRIQRWATETVHGSAAAEVLLLIRDLPAAPAEPLRNCFTDEAYRSSLTDSPEKPCDRVQPHPAHKHVAQRASWQCPGVAATPTA